MTNFLDLIGRIFISSVFLLSGYNKIFNYSGTVEWMEGYGVPGILLAPAIVIEIILPILIIMGYQVKIAAALLACFSIAIHVWRYMKLSNLLIYFRIQLPSIQI